MITRAHMRRQLRATGGITNARQGYGIGSWVKERVRKLIPNELANVASKAAPFVAPFFPGAAAAMRGIGRFDKRGSISDALKQSALTYGFGKGARYLGGATGPAGGPGSYNFSQGPIGSRLPQGIKDAGTGIKENIKSIFTPGAPGDKLATKGLTGLAKQQLLFGTISGGLTYIYEKFMKEEPEQQQGESYGEYLARRKKNVAAKMRQYKDNYLAFDKDWSAMDDEAKNKQIQSELTEYDVEDANMNQGGRVGYDKGTRDPKDTEEFDKILKRIEELQDMGLDLMSATKQAREEAGYNQGGRVGYAIGSPEKQLEAGAPPIIYEGNMDPRAQNQQAGLPAVPGPMQMAEDGPEFDMRQRGGFQPLGRQEGKDDVPAMLAKNEFVMTADSVRAAGGGSIQKGAQRMYDTMKKLESRVS